MDPSSRIKGQAFRGLSRALGALDPRATVRLLDGVGRELGDAMRYNAVVPSGWYPIAWFRELLSAAQSSAPQEGRLARRLGEEATRQDLGGVYAAALRTMGRSFGARQVERVLSLYLQPAAVHAHYTSAAREVLRLEAIDGFDDRMCDWVAGIVEAVARLTLGSSAVVRLVPGGRPAIMFDVRWTASQVAAPVLG